MFRERLLSKPRCDFDREKLKEVEALCLLRLHSQRQTSHWWSAAEPHSGPERGRMPNLWFELRDSKHGQPSSDLTLHVDDVQRQLPDCWAVGLLKWWPPGSSIRRSSQTKKWAAEPKLGEPKLQFASARSVYLKH